MPYQNQKAIYEKNNFCVFTFVYLATAIATLVAFLVEARLIRSDLPPGAIIPYLGLLIMAVLIETAGGYIGLARNLFGLKTLPETEAEIRNLTITALKTLNRLQMLAHCYSSNVQKILAKYDSLVFRKWLGESNVEIISSGNQLILESTKQIENAIACAENVLLTNDTKEIKALNSHLESFIPMLEKELNKMVSREKTDITK